MSVAISPANLLAYSAQLLCIIGVGAAGAALFRVDAAAVRYTYWRGIALLCLALPALQSRTVETPRAGAGELGTAVETAAVAADGVASTALSAAASAPWEIVLWVLAAGAAGRLVWLCAGLMKLRGLRHSGDGCDGEYVELQRLIGTRANVRYTDRVRQPVMFGLVKPIVLLPSALRGHPEPVRAAVVAHELLHVQRRDWAWVLVEELVRAIFWFHPAVWWLISNVQLAREEVVDELAVLVTGRRRTYVEALLAFADASPLAPAPAFARRRHLFRRMLLISKEAAMSPKQIVVSCAVMALMVAGGGWYAVRAFPLVGTAQEMTFSPRPDGPGALERKAVLITPENPIPRRISVVNADFPAEAQAAEVTARVSIQITLDEEGRVAESRLVGLDLHGARLESANRTDATPAEDQRRVGDTVRDAVEGQRLGDAFAEAALGAVRQWRYDPPYQAPISFPVTISFSLGGTDSTPGMPPPPPPPPQPGSGRHAAMANDWTGRGAVRVGGTIKTPKKLTHVDPVYPPFAKAAGIEGIVILEARIGADGRITDARVLQSIPLLDQAALDAVKHWTFEPTLLNGQPVPVTMVLTINFRLP